MVKGLVLFRAPSGSGPKLGTLFCHLGGGGGKGMWHSTVNLFNISLPETCLEG
jgi:hypothetical protein